MSVWTTMTSPLGALLLESDGDHLTSVLFEPWEPASGERDDAHPVLGEARAQLTAYFAGERRDFDLPLRAEGTEFQRRVWAQLRQIPYGSTMSYGEVAGELGLVPGASRAVGLANGRNPISIIVPCHRVIGADGSLTGYGGGIDRKRALLSLERDDEAAVLF
ncbi:MAG: methylated-DNA--[protein]-cysteine S-methyltransferase [Nocardioidaceae bacterium]